MGALRLCSSEPIISCNLTDVNKKLNISTFKHQLSLLRVLKLTTKTDLTRFLLPPFYAILSLKAQIYSKIVPVKPEPPQSRMLLGRCLSILRRDARTGHGIETFECSAGLSSELNAGLIMLLGPLFPTTDFTKSIETLNGSLG